MEFFINWRIVKSEKEYYNFTWGVSSILPIISSGKVNEVLSNQQNDFNYIITKVQNSVPSFTEKILVKYKQSHSTLINFFIKKWQHFKGTLEH